MTNPKMTFVRLLVLLLCVLSLNHVARADGSATELIAQGTHWLEQGQFDRARQAFEAAAQAEPRSVAAHMKLAGVNLAQNHSDAAIAHYQRVIGLDPKQAKAFIGLGIAYLHKGNKSLTRAAFAEAIRLEPEREAQLAPIIAELNAPE